MAAETISLVLMMVYSAGKENTLFLYFPTIGGHCSAAKKNDEFYVYFLSNFNYLDFSTNRLEIAGETRQLDFNCLHHFAT